MAISEQALPLLAPAEAGLKAAEAPAGDGELARAAGRGDRKAAAAIYEKYGRLVHAALLARVPPAEAEDLVQDVFVAALRRVHALRDGEALGAWLLAIARNRAADYWRRAPETESMPAEIGADGPPRAEANQVLERIRELPEAYREPLILRLVEGMSGAEIAAQIGLTPGSVRVNLHRGMKLLREALSAEEA